MAPKKKLKKGDESSSASVTSRGSLDALAAPLGLLGFALLLDCLKIFPAAFPLRTEVIAGILNQCLHPLEQVDSFAVYKLISKIKSSNATIGEIQVSTCINRPDVRELARRTNSLFIAFSRATTCLLCKCPLTWLETSNPRRPFFYPDGASPGKGIVEEKFCLSCSTVYSIDYYSPKKSEEKRPYPDSYDHQSWLELSGETLVSKDLLRRHDNNL
jgi:hypothetical protein